MRKPHSFVTCIQIALQLGKPRIIILLAITSMAGYAVATKGNFALWNTATFILSTLGLCISAMGANTVNMWWDRDIDPKMARTKFRPLPAGKITPNQTLALGIGEGVFAFVLLWVTVNPLTAWMSAAGYVFYVFIYTMWLKRRTVQNIVIGGAAGAFPPLVGWCAVQNNLADPLPWLMFAVIFFWTPPHFWALALLSNLDYTKAGVPMLPVVHGVQETKRWMLYYHLILIPVTLAIGLLPLFGYLYLFAATLLGGWWLYLLVLLLLEPENSTAHRPQKNRELCRQNFAFSIYYLAAIFAAMVVDTFV